MENWQDIGQSVAIGLIFSFLVSKLISTLRAFRHSNLKIIRETAPIDPGDEVPPQRQPLVEALGKEEATTTDDEDDGWEEGAESTELDEAFSAATTFVAATVADRNSSKVSNDVQLQLYGFYKIATEGQCTVPQPPAFKVTARAKWHAWQRLGAMPPEEAMQKYIIIVNEMFPTWADGSSSKRKEEDYSVSSSTSKGPMGPVFSSFIHEEESVDDLKLDEIHISAREGDFSSLLTHIENGVSVNKRDSEGRTPLHWAVDRGHIKIVEILIGNSAAVNAQDDEGQSALHYAVICEWEEIAELLVKRNADCDLKDGDGNSPNDLCSLHWDFMTSHIM